MYIGLGAEFDPPTGNREGLEGLGLNGTRLETGPQISK